MPEILAADRSRGLDLDADNHAAAIDQDV